MSRQSSSPEKSGGDEQDGQESESAQALQPPVLRDRTIERIASMTAARMTSDIMMVAIIIYVPFRYPRDDPLGLCKFIFTNFRCQQTIVWPVLFHFAAHWRLRRIRPFPSSFQVTYVDAVQDASQSSSNTVRSVPQKVRFRTYTPIQ
jgi:hypothetical protein